MRHILQQDTISKAQHPLCSMLTLQKTVVRSTEANIEWGGGGGISLSSNGKMDMNVRKIYIVPLSIVKDRL